LRALEEIGAELDSVRSRYDELKGLLRGYNAKAKDHGLIEDEQLSARYRPAVRAIAAAPCSLPDTKLLVEAYVSGGRSALEYRQRVGLGEDSRVGHVHQPRRVPQVGGAEQRRAARPEMRVRLLDPAAVGRQQAVD
jgi:hypothetical protein